jgi:hypothetical protein
VSLFVDVHIHFPICNFLVFKMLGNSYMRFKDHKLLFQVEDIFQSGASLNSVEINELMIANWNSSSRAIKLVITALQMDGDWRGVEKIESGLGNNAIPNTHIFFLKK